MKSRKIALGIVGMIIFYCLLLGVAAPLILKPMVSEQAKNFLNGSVTLDDIDINPFTNRISIYGLNIKNQEKQTLIKLDSAYANIDLLSLLILQLKIESLDLKGLEVLSPTSPLLKLPELSVENTSVFIFSSKVHIESVLINSLNLSPSLAKSGTNIDELLSQVDKLLIKQDGDIQESSKTDSPNTTQTTNETTDKIEAKTDAQDIAVKSPSETSTALEQDNHADNTKDSEKNSESENLQKAGEQKTSKQQASEQQTPDNKDEASWLAIIDNFSIRQARIDITDTMNSDEPLKTSVTDINLDAQNIYSDFSQDTQFKLSLSIFDGDIIIEGTANPITMNNNINYTLNTLQLSGANPYVEALSQASISSGSLTSSGTVKMTAQKDESDNPGKAFNLSLSNNTDINELKVMHKQFETPLIDCPRIQSSNLGMQLPANTVSLEAFTIDQCHITLVLRKDGSTNFDMMPKTDKSTEKNEDNKTTKTTETETNTGPILSINSIKLTNNQILVRDFTQGDEVKVNISPINAEVKNLGAGAKDLTKVKLDAKINEHAPLSVKGTGNFINPKSSSDIQAKLTNMGLTAFTPYTLNLSSRPIDKGALSLDLNIQIDDNKLDSKNLAVLSGFQLGAKQQHEGAGKLPLALAIAVLRDNDGNINIDIPIHGDLDDPSFSVFKQAVKVLTNLITKAATAPFSMMGGMISGENNTSTKEILFADNMTTLQPEQLKVSHALAKTLKAHPELALQVKAYIGQTEGASLTPEQQLQLIKQRQDAFKQSQSTLDVPDSQIVFIKSGESINTAVHGKLELSFFAL